MEQTFGSFVREKRMACGLSLRGLAAKLEVSPVYMSNIETDRKPAPAKEKLDHLIRILGLGQEDTELLLDLAAKSKAQQVSADLPEYIMERDIVRAALRTAKEVDATDAEWQEFIDRITRRGARGK
ncbi:helix-turn-helix domain-containing protein [Intestinimonas sp. HCP28S3_D6]|uniref:helix-turn-helix domain-containing protein n=1 Tax=Intestinimonas sp. HCP28S3_D6 TaxID=3438942 RepID=UPI003F89AF9F